jgi:tripartite-type tricarboxylate transporter receptor subunit TctC
MIQARFICKAILAAFLSVTSLAATAQGYPSRPVKMIVTVAAGGVIDTLARIFAPRLSATWGQQVIVENRPGAASIIATEYVARSQPDGYTLLVSSEGPFVLNPHLYSKLPYDPIKDFVPIAMLSTVSPVIAVYASVPVRSVPELIAYAKSHPGQLTYGSMGSGTYSHIAMEEFKRRAGVDIVHVPYKGSAPAMTDLLAGQTSMILVNLSVVDPYVKAGKLRLIGAATPKRIGSLPDLPTVSETSLPGFEANTWFGVLAPAKVPAEVVARVHADIMKIIATPGFLEQNYAKLGLVPLALTPEEFAQKMKTDLEHWGPIIKASGAKAD